jgi:hypothetical protein
MKNIAISFILVLMVASCKLPEKPKKSSLIPKNNYIILLDLSDRLIVQENQSNRDKNIIQELYKLFEEKVRKDLYIRSRDEIRVVIAPQKGSGLKAYKYEDKLYINMDNIPNIYRRKLETERRENFIAYLDTLYSEAVFSKKPTDYYGADIWKYFYEDLQRDYVTDTLTRNFLLILTDGYPIVGKNLKKLQSVKEVYPDLHVMLVEIAPRDVDLELDRIMELWLDWFKEMDIEDYTFIKRTAISKEIEQIQDIISRENK